MNKGNKNGANAKAPEHLNNKNKQAVSHPEPPQPPTPSEIEQDAQERVKEAQSDPDINWLENVEYVPTRWLWHERIPRGAITQLAGDPSSGKSFFIHDLAARIVNGWSFPGGGQATPGTVLIIDAESSLESDIKGRLKNTPHPNIGVISQITTYDEEGNSVEVFPDLQTYAHLIQQKVEATGADLLVIDPLNSFTGKADSNNDNDMRERIYNPLLHIAKNTGVAILSVLHLNKNTGAKASYRLNGSVANYGVPRSVFILADDPEQPNRKILEHKKSNNSAIQNPIAFQIKENDDKEPFLEYEQGTPDITASEALTGSQDYLDRQNKREQAKALYEQGYSYSEIAKEVEIGRSTVAKYLKS